MKDVHIPKKIWTRSQCLSLVLKQCCFSSRWGRKDGHWECWGCCSVAQRSQMYLWKMGNAGPCLATTLGLCIVWPRTGDDGHEEPYPGALLGVSCSSAPACSHLWPKNCWQQSERALSTGQSLCLHSQNLSVGSTLAKFILCIGKAILWNCLKCTSKQD